MRYIPTCLAAVVLVAGCFSSGGRTDEALARPRDPGSTAAGASDELPLIASLRSRDHQIAIHASPAGPLYTIRTASGEVVASRLTEDELAAREPGVFDDIRSLIAELWAGLDAQAERAEPRELPFRNR